MEITMKTIRLPLLCTVLFGVLLAFSQNARAFSTRGHEPDLVTNNGSIYVNRLIGMALSTNHEANGQYFHSGNNFNPASQFVQAVQMDSGYAGNAREVITIPGPGGGGTKTPDGGITAMLLGAALGALAMARRVLKI
jgi:hypothetical protein